MKRILLIALNIFAFSLASISQSRYIFIDFKDAQKPAITREIAFSEKTVNNGIEEQLAKLGFKGKESKGFVVYKSVTIPELGAGVYDLYFQIDKKSKKEKDVCNVNMMISKGNEVFVTDTDDPGLISNAKIYLDKLAVGIAAYDLDQQIESAENDVKQAEKQFRSLQKDADDLQRRKNRLEQDLVINGKDQNDQQKEIDKRKAALEELKKKKN